MIDLPARTPRPESSGGDGGLATEKQIGYALRLLDERGLLGATFDINRGGRVVGQTVMDEPKVRLLTKGEASNLITRLLGMPPSENRREWYPNVPDGRYALYLPQEAPKDRYPHRWYFFVVQTNERGFRKLYVQASDERHYVKNREYAEDIFKLIAEDPRKASLDYGRQLGQCGICGRTLTHPESIALGIGPICGERMGW